MVKMRLRQGHALQLAMDLGLHRSDRELVLAPQDEWQRDMRRRTWWIAFAQLCQASVLSGIVRTRLSSPLRRLSLRACADVCVCPPACRPISRRACRRSTRASRPSSRRAHSTLRSVALPPPPAHLRSCSPGVR